MSMDKMALILLFILCVILSSLYTLNLSVLILQLICGAITLALCVKIKVDNKMLSLLFVIYVVSLIFIGMLFEANVMSYGAPYYLGNSDDLQIELRARECIGAGVLKPSSILQVIGAHNSPGYVSYIASLMMISNAFDGYTTYIPRIINIFFLIWICLLLRYFLMRYTEMSDNAILYSIAIFGLTPNILYINAHVFRDSLNLLQILMAIWLFDYMLIEKKFHKRVIALIGFIVILNSIVYIRYNAVLFVVVIILVIFIQRYYHARWFIYLFVFVLLCLLAPLLLNEFKVLLYIKNYTQYILSTHEHGLSAMVFKQPILPLGIFLRAAYALICPFPAFWLLFQASNKILLDCVWILIYLGVFVQIILMPFIIHRLLHFDWLSKVFLCTFLPVIVSTFTFRHVIFYYPFMVALAVDGIYSLSFQKRTIYIVFSIISLYVLGFCYCIIKFL